MTENGPLTLDVVQIQCKEKTLAQDENRHLNDGGDYIGIRGGDVDIDRVLGEECALLSGNQGRNVEA